MLNKHDRKETLGENLSDPKSFAYLKDSWSSASDFPGMRSFEKNILISIFFNVTKKCWLNIISLKKKIIPCADRNSNFCTVI